MVVTPLRRCKVDLARKMRRRGAAGTCRSPRAATSHKVPTVTGYKGDEASDTFQIR